MSTLTDTMSRLCEQIVSLRKGREAFRMNLQHGNADRKAAVEQMCADFAKTRAELRRNTAAHRRQFLSNLRRHVHNHLQQTSNDLRGARYAWMGKAAGRP